ncbi:MAG: redoxin domain-containing protein [Alphaproteobacteria bacterium]|nr:redoxin domain-containing protein [Alphaproteobacteria bacterium]
MYERLALYTVALLVMAAFLPIYGYKAHANIEVGKPAPDFSATDIHGEAFALSDHKGKTVVLEWTNHLCPFVKKHYDSGNMQATQKTATDNGVIWVSIVSSAPEKQGHVSAQQAIQIEEEAGAHATTRILDERGEIGRLYEAKTTPHMFVINPEGSVAYAGAIDSDSSPDPATIEGATNYVLAAIEDITAGREVQTAATWPYGCAVKY